MSNREYLRERTLEADAVTATSSGKHRVAIALEDETVVVVDTEGQTSLAVDGTITDLAVGEQLYLADSHGVSALDLDGRVQWSTDFADPSAVAYLPGPATVFVSTEEEYVGLDAVGGSETFRVNRPHADVAATHELAAGTSAAVIGAWLFLTAITGNGEIRSEVQMDGAIQAIGVLEGLAVTLMKDGRLVTVDIQSGETHWERDAQVDWLASGGNDELLIASDRTFSLLAPDGQQRSAGTLSSGTPAVATSGDPLCIADGSEIGVFRPAESITPVSGALRSEQAIPDEPLQVNLQNGLQESLEATLKLESTELNLESSSVTVELGPGKSSTVEFPVSDGMGSTATIRVLCTEIRLIERDPDTKIVEGPLPADEAIEVTRDSIPISDRETSDRSTLNTELDVEAIDGGALVLRLSIHNRSREEVRELTCFPVDEGIERVPANETVTRSLTVPLDTDEIRVSGPDASGAAVVPAVPSPQFEVSIESGTEGFVDIRLRNRADFELRDEVTVRGESLPGSVTRSLVLDARETTRLLLPATSTSETGTVEVETSTGVESGTVSVSEPAIDLHRDDRPPSDHPDPETAAPDSPTAAAEGNQENDKEGAELDGKGTLADERPSSRSDETSTESSPGSPAPPDGQPASDRYSDDADVSPFSADEDDQDSSRQTLPAVPTEEERSEEKPTDSESVETTEYEIDGVVGIERSLAATELQEGIALREDLTVTTRRSSPAILRFESGEQQTEVQIPDEESVVLRRFHAAYGDTGTIVELPAVTATGEVGHVSLPSESVPLVSSEFRPRVSFIDRDTKTTVLVEVHNDLPDPVNVMGISALGLVGFSFEEFVVKTGERDERELSISEPLPETPCLATLQVDVGGIRTEFKTVASMPSLRARWLNVTVADVNELDDGEFNLTLAVHNQGTTTLSVEMQARGDAPDEYLYSGTVIDEVPPGKEISHRIECTIDDPAVEVPVDLEVSVVGVETDTTLSETVSIVGRVGSPPADWTVKRGAAEATNSDVEVLTTPLSTENE